ncbi:MAG TPA: glycosyltransferase family 4 protein [Caulobacteraceae bacterium]|jgi:glycosyltransferase involved in cell wall biosynthesis|nr:glycosyltransferase family 4 protein [Caulobacteraceae bacterium]
MSNAAISFYSDAFQTGGAKLMGRQAAGESFLRGFLRHSGVEQFYFCNWTNEPLAQAEALIRRIEPVEKPFQWIGRGNMRRLSEPGCLFVSAPANAQEAWNRRLLGANLYSICGLTHTTASGGVMDALVAMLEAPVEPWDALICTSRAVAESVALQQDLMLEYLRERFGPIKAPQLRLETIPLGINADDFTPSPQYRAEWRAKLGIEEDAIAVLYVGRFSPHAKMNPLPMAMALERAAQRTKRPIHWILSGWASNEYLHAAFAEAGPRFAPSIKTHVLDGRRPDVRFPIWSAGDIFLSLSDNIQETFGLTPVEAMAAGLPSVISDWDGYRDLIRHGVQGFRVPTLAPRPGGALDLAVAHANGWETFDHYVGMASQFVAVDIDAAADALVQLIDNEDLRRTMGAAAQERARTVFDWKTVIGQYQALWAELAAIRKAAPARPAGGLSPWRPDPFQLFAGYPTQGLAPEAVATLAPGATIGAVQAMLREPTIAYAASTILTAEEIAAVVGVLQKHGPTPVAVAAAATAPSRRGVAARSLLWMAKFGFVTITPRPEVLDR